MSKITDEEIDGLDLSSLRAVLNGSEAVMPDTIERFARRFEPYGFNASAMCPVYGMAEASVGLTVSPICRPPKIDRVSRQVFEETGQAVPAEAQDQAPLRFVSCGHPLDSHEIRIVDEEGEPAGERVQGRVHFRGPSVTRGYFRNPEATRAISRPGGWVDSGDLGYWADDELFLTGRIKDVIIKAGRNIHPHEAEELVGALPGVRKGCVATFGVRDPSVGTERLVVVAETRETKTDRRDQIRTTIIDRVTSALGLPPDEVVLGPPGAVLKTSSGKVRRSATREAYSTGALTLGRRSAGAQWSRVIAETLAARSRRLLETLGSALFTAYLWVFLGATLVPLWALVAGSRSQRAAERAVRRWCRLALLMGRCRVDLTGVEHLRGLESAILVANHASYLDPVALLGTLQHDFTFVAKGRLASYPILGTVIRRCGYLTIEKADVAQRMAGADQVLSLLRSGQSLMVFPEGTFVRASGMLPFRLGSFRAAVEASRPVVPVAIQGTRRIFPAGTRLLRPGGVSITIGPPIFPQATGWAEMVRLRDLTRAAIGLATGEELV